MRAHSATLRFVLLQLVLTLVAAMLVFGFLAWRTDRLAMAEVRNKVAEEMALVVARHDSGGMAAAAASVAEIEAAARSVHMVVRLEDRGHRAMAGNLAAWPPVVASNTAWRTLSLYRIGASEARLFGVTATRLGDGRLLIGRGLEERQAVLDTLSESLALGLLLMLVAGVVGGLVHARYTLGQLEAIEVSACAIIDHDPDGRIATSGRNDEFDRLGIILNDLLDRQQRQRRVVETIATSLGHDVRTPLARMRQAIESAPPSPVLERLDDEIVRLLAFIKTLLETARARAGVGAENFELLDFSALIAETVDLYSPVATDAGMPITATIAPGLQVRGSRQLLSQAVINLIENALAHAGGSGPLAVTADIAHSEICFTIADHGPGIAAADIERVQEPFVRLDASRSGDGHGLGLALVAGIAALHRGALRLDDNSPGLAATLALPRIG